jgi:hypothetical protein
MTAGLKKSSSGASRDDLPFVTGQMKFATKVGEGPNTVMACKVYDARPIVGELSLDREGFQLIHHESELARQGDVDLLRREALAYLDDVAPAIRDALGASWVVPRTAANSGVVVRSATKIVPGEPFHYVRNKGAVEVPFPGVHLDYSAASALQLARAENHQRGIPERPFSRMIIIQAWRATSPPPQDRPLALMDASTLRPEDTFITGAPLAADDLSGDGFQTRGVVHNPDQRWYYFSDMLPGDLMLFKGYDSENLATPPHASFLNETAAGRSHPRESVEGRFFCYFD